VRRDGRRRRWRFFTFFPRIKSRDGSAKKFEMVLSSICLHALGKAKTAFGSQLVSSVIENIPVRRSTMGEHFITMDLSRAFPEVQIQAQAT
jgi:RNase P/RNase MRP subunit POP5